MAAYSIQHTPNPDSLKFATTGKPFIEAGLATFGSADEAAGDPLASDLFAIRGVADVLILPGFLTITKSPAADWKDVLPAVETVLQKHVGG